MPIAGSVISIIGRPHSTTGDHGNGLLVVTVEDIIYNLGTAHILDTSRSDPTGAASSRKLQVKKRKRAPTHVQSGSKQDSVGKSL